MQRFSQVSHHFLVQNELQEKDLSQVLGLLGAGDVDAADIYFQHITHEMFFLEDGIIKEGSYNVDQGVGLRAISGEKTGFSYCNTLSLSALQEAARAAQAIASQGLEKSVKIETHKAVTPLYTADNPLQTLTHAQKMELLHTCDRIARQEPLVSRVTVSLNGVHELILVAALDGTLQADVRPLVRLNVNVVVDSHGRRESGTAGGGGRYGYTYFIEQNSAERYAREAVRRALVNLEAKPAPAGAMKVVLGPGWPGVLLHEAVGHGLEGDFNRKGTSTFSGRIGEQVASSVCTVVDDGTLPHLRGSLTCDDEGTPTQRTVLIENGILKGYLQDKHNAFLMNTRSTGNGRRESYAALPMPRMTNTFLLPGVDTPEDIIASVDDGIYAVNFDGGSVDITSGKFVFSMSEAYKIEKGKITYPIKGATLVGMGPEVMQKISRVANDLALDTGIGVCGKDGQSVPVGVGQPTLLVDEIVVGGTQ